MAAASGGIIGRGRPADDREPARKLVKDSTDTSLMQTGRGRDLSHPMTLHPQPNDFVMGRWACAENLLPELATLGFLTGAALGGVAQRPGRCVFEGLLSSHGSPVLLAAIGEPSPCDSAQERFQMPAPGEMPGTIADAPNQVGKNRLDDINRIDLRPEPRAQAPANCDSKIGLISAKDRRDRFDVADIQTLNPLIQ
jgi:hypothetical protein